MDRFVFTGKISRVKENELEVRTFESGWTNTKLNFVVLSGDNRHFLTITSGKWSDDKKNSVMTYTKSANGVPGEKITIEWNERLNPENVDKVAGFRRFVIDLTDGGERDDDSYKQFIHNHDFITEIVRLLEDGALTDKVVEVSGNIEHSYSASKGRFYTNYVPTRIKVVDDDTPQVCEGNVIVYYCREASGGSYLDLASVDTDKVATLNGYTKYYDSSAKKNGYAPIAITIPMDSDKKLTAVKLLFGADNDRQVRRIGIKVRMLNGSQKVSVTEATLTDEQKQFIEAGLMTLDDIKAEVEASAYGERITANIMCGLMVGYTRGSAVEDAMTSIDLITPPISDTYVSADTTKSAALPFGDVSDTTEDLFDIFN